MANLVTVFCVDVIFLAYKCYMAYKEYQSLCRMRNVFKMALAFAGLYGATPGSVEFMNIILFGRYKDGNT